MSTILMISKGALAVANSTRVSCILDPVEWPALMTKFGAGPCIRKPEWPGRIDYERRTFVFRHSLNFLR